MRRNLDSRAFFRKTTDIHAEYGSNGTLLNAEWIEFFSETGCQIGLSIDGPEWLHDLHRKDRASRGTFGRAIAGARLLHDNSIPFTNIATLTSDSLDHADEIFDFFFALGPAKLAFNIEEAEGANAVSSLYRKEFVEKVESFFARIAELNFKSSKPFRIREIESVLTSLAIRPSQWRTSQETEFGRIVAIGVNGDVALFSPELLTTIRVDGSRAVVGNLLNSDFQEIIESSSATLLKHAIDDGVAICRSNCDFFDFCGGGSPANKYYEHHRFDVAETWFCRLSKKAATKGILRAINLFGDQEIPERSTHACLKS